MRLQFFGLKNLFFSVLGIAFFSICIWRNILNNNLFETTSYKINKTNDLFGKINSFKSTIQFDCDPKKIEINKSCLLKLEQFDFYFFSQKHEKNIAKDACENCLIYSNCSKGSTKVYYHTFWQFDTFDSYNNQHKNRLRMINLNFMSYLATQNLCCSKFIMWKLSNFPLKLENAIKEVFGYYINKDILEIRTFSVDEFCGSDFFKNEICSSNNDIFTGRYLVAFSDMVRFAVLDKYPGIYTDGDTIYLKDMRYLWYINFAYRWSFLNAYNTAVMGFNKYLNPFISELLDSIKKNSSSMDDLIRGFHPQSVTRHVDQLNKLKGTIFNYDPLLALHSYFFDGAWLCNDGKLSRKNKSDVCIFREFSSTVLTDEFDHLSFFKGAFADHLHYKETEIKTNSYFYHFEKYYLNSIDHLNVSFYKQYHNL